MKLFIISGNTLNSAQELSQLSGGKIIGGRTAIISSDPESGIINTNLLSTIPTLIHIPYIRFTLPKDNVEFNQYQDQNRNIKAQLQRMPTFLAANNEIYYTANLPFYNHNMKMVADMSIFLRSLYYEYDTTILTCGIGTGISRSLVQRYYTENNMKSKLASFMERLSGSDIYQPYQAGADDFLTELEWYKSAGILRLMTNIHYNVSRETIGTLQECIKAVQYYSQPYRVVIGELSFHEPDVNQVTEAMDIIQVCRIKTVGIYDGTANSGRGNRATVLTDAMKKVIATYAS